jgi:hypothetical protein
LQERGTAAIRRMVPPQSGQMALKRVSSKPGAGHPAFLNWKEHRSRSYKPSSMKRSFRLNDELTNSRQSYSPL